MMPKPRFRLTPPVRREHPLQRLIADCLRLELGPPGRVSRAGVVWWATDIADYAGAAPGTRSARGIIPGVADMFVLHRGRAHFAEVKADDGRLSEEQELVAAAVLAAGGRVAVVRDAAEMLACLDEWAIPRAQRLREATP